MTFRDPEVPYQERAPGAMRERYGPRWGREIAEPMTLAYMEQVFPCIREAWWASELSTAYVLEKNGIDGILAIASSPKEGRTLLGVQVSVAGLQSPRGREIWSDDKIRPWLEKIRQHELYRLGREASVIGGREGDSLPVVFIYVPEQDIELAWEKLPSRPDWRAKDAPQFARRAAQFLPQSVSFRREIIDTMLAATEKLLVFHPDLLRRLRPVQLAFMSERERLTRSAQSSEHKI